MQLPFFKYHGTGNDFILLDNREAGIRLSREQVAALCHRRFGIGADGLMLLETVSGADFRMVYYNSDGGESSMCGNGGRCIVAFAKRLALFDDEARFIAVDGPHEASIEADGNVCLQMKDVSGVQRFEDHAVLDTGSPHYVQWVDDVQGTKVFDEGRIIRNQDAFAPGGINVNFVQRAEGNVLHVRTYERGVEDETMSCGTGVTAAAIAASGSGLGHFEYSIQTPGGELKVAFNKPSADTAVGVTLTGPATFVYHGEVDVKRETRDGRRET